jgi:hypothetical protein
MDAGEFDGFFGEVEADEIAEGEEVDAAEVVIGVRGGEAVEVGTGDGGEEEGVGLPGEDFVEAGIVHGKPFT